MMVSDFRHTHLLRLLHPIVGRVDREYGEFLRRVLSSHGSESGIRRFCEAQLLWDTAMAIYALEYLKEHPEQTAVVLCGMIHAWKKTAPDHATRKKRPRSNRQSSNLP